MSFTVPSQKNNTLQLELSTGSALEASRNSRNFKIFRPEQMFACINLVNTFRRGYRWNVAKTLERRHNKGISKTENMQKPGFVKIYTSAIFRQKLPSTPAWPRHARSGMATRSAEWRLWDASAPRSRWNDAATTTSSHGRPSHCHHFPEVGKTPNHGRVWENRRANMAVIRASHGLRETA